ncbi:hypothetical protein PVAND_009846 [Polypedilum vanderplanki]|uniref:Uncharacterized protein n=1 Tax=Polypedilum vanderplanki TaxID=319348 RepID=A0A9J6CEH6_POLVA|nr:hypothetical protein PVAND_009846 [Polypedilum vanderplanki]
MESMESKVNLIEMSQKLYEQITYNTELHSKKEEEYQRLIKEKDEKILQLEESLNYESWRANAFREQVKHHKREIDNVKFEKSNYFMHLATSKTKIRNLEKDLNEKNVALEEAIKTLKEFQQRIRYLENHVDEQDGYVDILHSQIDKYRAELGEDDEDEEEVINACIEDDEDEEVENLCENEQQQTSDNQSKENFDPNQQENQNDCCDLQKSKLDFIQEEIDCENSSESPESQNNSNNKSVSFVPDHKAIDDVDPQVNMVTELQFGDVDDFEMIESICNQVDFNFQSDCDICQVDSFDDNATAIKFIQDEEVNKEQENNSTDEASDTNIKVVNEEAQVSTSPSYIEIEKSNKRTKKLNKKCSKPTAIKKAKRSFSKLFTFGSY